MFMVESIHHVSLPITNPERSRQFYSEVLGLAEIHRPPFDFEGVWYQVGDRQLHLIVHDESTFREKKPVDSRDIQFAIRVNSYEETRDFLRSKGFHPEATDELKRIKESPHSTAGRPQLYIMDPDRNVLELNADRLDEA
jgi:catechol 2,3-dioxygenase-like lactoylglutathione lyase family enzyme